jgi:ABC-2 type transport system permease protein
VRGLLSMVLRELKALRKEKTIVFAILVQMFIASFSSVILLGIMVYYDPGSIGQNTKASMNVGVIGDKQGQFAACLRESHNRPFLFDDAVTAEAAFKSGKLDSIVYVPEKVDGVVDMKLVLPDMDAQATVALMLLKTPMERYENSLRQQGGVRMRYQDAPGKPFTTYEFLYTIIIPILMFFPAFIAGSMVIDSISEEIENKTLDTLLSTPISMDWISGAKILASVVVGAFQCALWIILLGFNGFSVQNAGLIMLLSVMVTSIVATTALIVSLVFRDRERSQFIYSLVILVLFALTYFISPSPFALVAGLATGNMYSGVMQLLPYVLTLIAITAVTPLVTRKLTSS